MKKTFKALILLVAVFMTVTLVTGCSTETSGGSSDGSSNSKKTYALGETFNFDDLEITLGTDISFTKNDNEYADNYNKDIVKIPVTVKNLKDETHSLNMFYYKGYGSQGTELDSETSYFDDGIDEAGDLRSGASYTKYFYFVYDGDGTYAIEFDNYTDKITVEFEVKK